LIARSKVLISCGENLIIPPGSDLSSVVAGAPNILQPAIAKSCGLSTAVKLVPLVEKAGKDIYPHYLSGAPGLAASAQLASIARAQHVEWDINPNPMRTSFFSEPFTIKEGYLELTSQPGIGWQSDPTALTEWLVQKKTVSAVRK
jgi:L-alanine-DL-glutamate epimerase-like enolase superfamily enzyme